MKNMVETRIESAEQTVEDIAVSGPGSDGHNSPDFWDEFGEQISAEIEKRFQSAKDKRWSELEKKYGALAQASGTPDGLPSQPDTPDYARLQLSLNTFLSATGLLNQAGVLEGLSSLTLENPVEEFAEILMELSRMVIEGRNGLKASPANQVHAGGRIGDHADLQAEYRQRKARLRAGDINGLMELKREFRQKGLDLF